MIDKHKIARATGIPALINFIYRKRPLVLAYHGIYDGPWQREEMPDTFVHVDAFKEQLSAVKQRYAVIEPEQFKTYLENGQFLPPSAALITFDDGYESFYRLAMPVLNSLEIKPVVFVATRNCEENTPFWYDWVWLFFKTSNKEQADMFLRIFKTPLDYENLKNCINQVLIIMKRMDPPERDSILIEMDRIRPFEDLNSDPRAFMFYGIKVEQIRDSANSGVDFGGHTHTHTILSSMSENQAEKEIGKNKRNIEAITGKACQFFAYPNGGCGDFTSAHKSLIKKAGYVAAFSLTQKRSLALADLMGISRFNVASEDTVSSLTFRLTGILPLIRWNMGKKE